MLSNSLQTELVAINDIKPYPRHARKHDREQRRKLARLIERFGQVVPIVIDQSNVIVDGHLVWAVMKDAGHRMISVIRVVERSGPDMRALRLALNRMPQDSRWNQRMLKTELAELVALSFDMEFTAFEVAEIDAALELDLPEANTIEDGDDIPAVTEVAVSEFGDIWRLDDHRLRCGDALSVEDMDAVMSGESARMVFTDPPYNVPIDEFVSGLGKVKHREFAQASGEISDAQFTAFLTAAMQNAVRHSTDGALIYWCTDWRHLFNLLETGRASKLELVNLCVWIKTNAGMGSLYRSQHELVLIFKSGAVPHVNNVEPGRHGRSRSDVWPYRGLNTFAAERNELLASHPTIKPTLLIADAIRDVTRRGDIVLDPFLGLGSTLIAAEQTGRLCRAIEVEPRYVDVAIRRWQKLTGRDAVHAAKGTTFHESCAEKGVKEVSDV